MKITSGNINQILYCDYRKDENKQLINDTLHTIPQFKKKTGKVPQELIEKMINHITGKYAVTVQWITYVQGKESEVYWSCSIRNDDGFKYINSITAYCMYELLAKITILLYALVKGYNGGLVTREDLEIAKEWESAKHVD